MDYEGMNELSQGNTMLSEMRNYNEGVREHNLGVKSEFAQKINDANQGLKNIGSEDDYSTKLTEKIGGGVLGSAVGDARAGYTAYKALSEGQAGFNDLGLGKRLLKTAGKTFADAPLGRAVGATGRGLASAGRGVASVPGRVQQGLFGLGDEPVKAVEPAEETLGPDYGGRDPSVGALGGREVGVSGAPDVPATSTSTLSRGGSGVAGATEAGEPAPVVKAPVTAPGIDPATDDNITTKLGKAGEMGENLGKMAQGLGVVTGGISLVKDIAGGHIAGDNDHERAGNELGIASGFFDALGFVLPGAGLIGAGLGVASTVEGEVGKYDEAKKQITTTLPGEEKGQMTQAGPSAGATSESAGQVSSVQTTAQSKISSGASAF
tara:strand:+ start:1370 stop:2506 length:1137 start_codon:yes stop_codon:yes gene_type:complete